MNNAVSLASDYPLLNLFWTIAIIFLWLMWFMLLFRVIGDIFRDHELSGWGKALWTLFVVILPFLGVLVYLIARGGSMHERDVQRAKRAEEEFQTYVRAAAGTSGSTDELARLAELRKSGDITEEEYAKAKARVLG
ncbi:ABC-type multidrug transport system fused ATPase/permease subunit [Kitasatospora sp. MAA4]|uniref:SHOCT domain-containing protein n=1 Tax=Kitasatospora sp. MAA4 TaxID=3035093 RepID=UPI002475A060|nr:SHOCT domain-containing protein [Kitasatospora sp. MAA4]MDH6137189.1 ABC-type multidrug transport system fused ATPase/permease subunit [Kitasatospora sp. MAA4]